jgi:hypothetical protein
VPRSLPSPLRNELRSAAFLVRLTGPNIESSLQQSAACADFGKRTLCAGPILCMAAGTETTVEAWTRNLDSKEQKRVSKELAEPAIQETLSVMSASARLRKPGRTRCSAPRITRSINRKLVAVPQDRAPECTNEHIGAALQRGSGAGGHNLQNPRALCPLVGGPRPLSMAGPYAGTGRAPTGFALFRRRFTAVSRNGA